MYVSVQVFITLLGGCVILSAFQPQQSDIKRYANILLACIMVILLIALWLK